MFVHLNQWGVLPNSDWKQIRRKLFRIDSYTNKVYLALYGEFP